MPRLTILRGPPMSSTLDLALDYLTWFPNRYLFPIAPGKKTPPLIRDNLKKASNDFEQIRRWHERWPHCNWGLALALSELFCVDVDKKPGKNGARTWELLDLLYGWPATEMALTPSGGEHHLYEGEHKFGLGKYGFGEDIDAPNYILIPGCTLDTGGEYSAAQSPPIAPAPPWFYELFAEHRAREAIAQEPEVELDQPGNIEWAEHYLQFDAPPSIEGQNGEVTTLLVAGALKDHAISEPKAVELMAELYNVDWEIGHSGFCEPLWSMDEAPVENSLPIKVRNAYGYLKQNAPGEATAEAEFKDDPPPDEKDSPNKKWDHSVTPETAKEQRDKAENKAAVGTPPKDVKPPKEVQPPPDDDPPPDGSPPQSKSPKERAQDAAAKIKARQGNEYIPTQSELCEHWVYVRNSKLFVCRDDLDLMWDKEGFDNAFGYAKGSATKLSKAVLERAMGTIRKPMTMGYSPIMDFIPDKSDVADPEKYNIYRPSDIVAAPGDTTLWNAHIAYLFPEQADRDHVLNWWAWLLQNISRKPKHALLVAGHVQGTGKSLIGEVMTKILGAHNVSPVGEDELSSTFNEWALRAKLILIEELRTIEKNHVAKKLHPLITQERIKVNDKNIKRITIDNCFGFFGMTNDDAAIPLDNTDRRYLVVRTNAVPKDKAYYDALYLGLLNDRAALAAIAHELLHRDIGTYSAADRAPYTAAKGDMIIAGLGDLESWMVERGGEWPLNGRIIRLQDVEEVLPRRLERINRLIPNIASILRHRFKGIPIGQHTLKNGDRASLWAINGSAVSKIAGAPYAAIYEADRAKAGAGAAKASDAAGDFAP